MDDLTKPLDEESIKVTMDDFVNALHEITPAFGASTDNLERCRLVSHISNAYLKCWLHDFVCSLGLNIAYLITCHFWNNSSLLMIKEVPVWYSHSRFAKLLSVKELTRTGFVENRENQKNGQNFICENVQPKTGLHR
jgi:hypothetical protein